MTKSVQALFKELKHVFDLGIGSSTMQPENRHQRGKGGSDEENLRSLQQKQHDRFDRTTGTSPATSQKHHRG